MDDGGVPTSSIGIVHVVYGTIHCQDGMCDIGRGTRNRGKLGMTDAEKSACCPHIKSMSENEELWAEFAFAQSEAHVHGRDFKINTEDAGLELAFEETSSTKLFNTATGQFDFGGVSTKCHTDETLIGR